MDKYEMIIKLAKAAELVEEVKRAAGAARDDELQSIADNIAEVADKIEGVEQ